MSDAKPEVSVAWATDGIGGTTDDRGWPASGVLLFTMSDSSGMIAAQPRSLSETLLKNGFLAIGVGSILVAGDIDEWAFLLGSAGSGGVRPGLIEAPLTRRSDLQFTAWISPREVVVH